MSKDYTVGYRRPPMQTRFEKGRSGNPKGRPRGSRNIATELAEELNQTVVIKEDGRQRRVTKRRALIKRLAQKALSGEAPAVRLIFELDRNSVGEAPPAELAALSPADRVILGRFLKKTLGSEGDR